ncbi:twin-arginine translocase TatA/TatE family subunit [Thermodesulfovibrionales bacterium]|nr:twin-arginine translocase TatA/TatE family subunit [Thermodesulfovibrionales bacterium]
MIPGVGMTELIIILVIVLVLFGAKRLPELASGFGKAIKNFKKATSEPDEIDVTPKKAVAENRDEIEEKQIKQG